MPIVKLNNEYLTRLTRADIQTIRDNLPMMGSEVEREEEEQTDVQYFPNRPDLYSAEGTARALRGYLGIETGLPQYTVKPSGITFTVDENLKNIRPYLGSAVIRNVNMDTHMIESIMGLQESLHWQWAAAERRSLSESTTLTKSKHRSSTRQPKNPWSLSRSTMMSQ